MRKSILPGGETDLSVRKADFTFIAVLSLSLIILISLLAGAGGLAAQNIYTIAGNGFASPYPGGFSGDGGPATGAELSNPYSVATDGAGNIYIADYENNCIRKVNTAGFISTIAGNETGGFSGDGGPATAAELNGPVGIAADGTGNIYIADQYNERIREVHTDGIIFTMAGNGTGGFSGDGGPATAAEINGPSAVATDEKGDIYIADYWNNRIREVNSTGKIYSVAGNGIQGYSGDGGPAIMAEFDGPTGVATDYAGNIYIADEFNECIRRVNAGALISTFAGNGANGYSGDGALATAAELFNPSAVATDRAGNVYIADYSNELIRKVNSGDTILTLTGNGIAGFSGDGGPATTAELNAPNGISTDYAGNVYIADGDNDRIREVTTGSALAVETMHKMCGDISVYPNPAMDEIYVKVTSNGTGEEMLNIKVLNMLGRVVYCKSGGEETDLVKINASALAPGIYMLQVITDDKSYTQKILVSH